MGKHTPGPWSVARGGMILAERPFICGDTREGITVAVVTINAGIAASEANARLIAAAPDLLAAICALSDAVWVLRQGGRDGSTMGAISIADDDARAAIARATND